MSEGKTEEIVAVIARQVDPTAWDPTVRSIWSSRDKRQKNAIVRARAILAAIEAKWFVLPLVSSRGLKPAPTLMPGTRVEFVGLLGAKPGEVRRGVVTSVVTGQGFEEEDDRERRKAF